MTKKTVTVYTGRRVEVKEVSPEKVEPKKIVPKKIDKKDKGE